MAELYTWQETQDGAQLRTELMLLEVDRCPTGAGWRITVYANGKYVKRRSPYPLPGPLEEVKASLLQTAKRLLRDEMASLEEVEKG